MKAANPTEKQGTEILVVDDASESRLVLSTSLKRAGYSVRTCTNGKEAWNVLEGSEVAMVVCDWMMPEMDGLELCRQVRQSVPDHYVYFILCTSRGSRTDFMEAMEGGVDDFISKPIDPEELRVRVAAGERVLRLERELRNQHRTLEEKNAELEQFAYVASHDLKEPLRKINHFAERLVARHSGSLDADAWDYLQRITRAVERMQRLVDDLLTLARVSSTAKPFSPVDLNRLLEDVMSDLEPLVATVGGRVEFGNGGSLPVVMGDEGQLRQLFQNLIGNALKFQRPGVPPLVRIYASPSEASPDKCDTRPYGRIVVEDNGIGFRSQDAEKIFQIFRRLHGRDQYEGTGIGLSVCKKVVQRHQGQIWATGQPNQGAKFTVLLPHV